MRQASMTAATGEIVAGREQEPGQTFVQAYLEDGLGACVEYDRTITHGLGSQRRKPRYPARGLFKIVNLSADPRRFYWHESPSRPGDPPVTGAGLRRELANRFAQSPVPELLPTTAWVQVPPGLWEDQEAFASFIDHRLIMRLGTAENHTLIRGEGGLLTLPGIARMTSKGQFSSTIPAACNEVEQAGCTPDGLIINPADYYQFLGSSRLMHDLDQNGVLVVRTRLVDQGTAIIGDFTHGALLFDAGRSVIKFAEPPPGTFAEPGPALMAQIHERVVVNLPATFFVISL